MGFFNETIAAYSQERVVRFSYLIELRFTPTPAYFHTGSLPSIDAGGKTWVGLRQMGQIEGIEQALNGESKRTRLMLSGAALTADIVQLAMTEDQSGYIGAIGIIWLQFFDADWAKLDEPAALHPFIIDGLPIERDEGPNGSTIRRIGVEGNNIFSGRRIATGGYYTDSDQQLRFPGDLGMQFIPPLADKTIEVPWT